jgi:hypothetical protein
MGRVFEDYLGDMLTEMVAASLEYAPEARAIYIYGSAEKGAYAFNVFYNIDGQILKKHQVNESGCHSFDISDERQFALLHFGADEMIKFEERCKEFQQPMPTQIKLVYDAGKNSMKSDLSYDIKYSNTKDVTSNNIFNSWYDEVRAQHASQG